MAAQKDNKKAGIYRTMIVTFLYSFVLLLMSMRKSVGFSSKNWSLSELPKKASPGWGFGTMNHETHKHINHGDSSVIDNEKERGKGFILHALRPWIINEVFRRFCLLSSHSCEFMKYNKIVLKLFANILYYYIIFRTCTCMVSKIFLYFSQLLWHNQRYISIQLFHIWKN